MTATPIQAMQSCVCINYRVGRFGIQRGLKKDEFEVAASKDQVNARKKLIDSPELEDVVRFDNETRAHVRNRSLPSIIASGVYMVTVEALDYLYSYLTEREAERIQLVNAFVANYSTRVDAASRSKEEGGLGPLFDSSQYPSAPTVRQRFTWSVSVVSFDVPGELNDAKRKHIFEAEKAKMADHWEAAIGEWTTLLRTEFSGFVDHMVEKLQPTTDGKRKKFHGTLVPNVVEFLDNFKLRDIANDEELSVLIERARAVLKDVNTNDLKMDEGIREDVTTGFAELKKSLDGLVVTKPKRRILV